MEFPVEWIAPGVTLILAGAGYLKNRAEVERIKASRAETKGVRDKDSLELHDQCQKNTWDISSIKDEMKLLQTQHQDSEHEIAILVKEVAVVSTKLDNLIELVKKGDDNGRA